MLRCAVRCGAAAPEVHQAGNLGKAADIYSYGVVLWEMFHNK